MSISMFPDQVAALLQLLVDTGGTALDVSEDEHRSLRVVVFTRAGDHEDALPEARWFSVSVAGTVREVAATPEQVAA